MWNGAGLENVGRVAERTATSVSRRQVLGRLGRCAMVVAAMLGGGLVAGAMDVEAR